MNVSCPCILLLWHHLAASAAPISKTSTSFLFMKTLTACFCDITVLLLPPLPVISRHASVCLTFSTPHLAHACHSGQHALVVAFPGNLAEEKVDFIIIRIVGVCNGVSRYKLGLCERKRERKQRLRGVWERLVYVFQNGTRRV